MIRALGFFLFVMTPAWAETTLPSGLTVTPHDVLAEEQVSGETWLVLRYISAELQTNNIGYEDVLDDLLYLCETDGLKEAESHERQTAQINIILMDRPVERGVPSPAALQYIGAYLPENERCAWNDF